MTHASLQGRYRIIGRLFIHVMLLFVIGIVVGIACVLLPPATSFGIVSLAFLLLLWVMPDLRATPAGWLSSAFLPFIFSILCVPVYYAIILPGLPWISVRRSFLMMLVIPFCLVISGSSRARGLLRSSLSSLKSLEVCIFGFMMWVGLSTLTASNLASSLNYVVTFTLTVILPMLSVILSIKMGSQIERLFRLTIFCVGLNLTIGIAEHINQKPFLIYALPAYMREQIFAQNPLAIISYETGQGLRGGMYRAASTFTNSLTWGEMSAMLIPLSLHFIAHSKTPRGKMIGCLGAVMCGLSVFFSGSRGAYVGVIAATIVYTIVWAFRSCRLAPGSLGGRIWLTAYIITSSAAMLAILFVQRIHNMVLGGGDSGYSTQARFDEWELAKPKIILRPFTGYGAGAAADVIHYTGFAGPGSPPSVDCYLLNLLVDYGVPGFAFFSCIFFVSIWTCFKIYICSDSKDARLGGAIGASMVAFVIYRLTLSQTDSLAVAFILVGLTFVLKQLTERHLAPNAVLGSRPRL